VQQLFSPTVFELRVQKIPSKIKASLVLAESARECHVYKLDDKRHCYELEKAAVLEQGMADADPALSRLAPSAETGFRIRSGGFDIEDCVIFTERF